MRARASSTKVVDLRFSDLEPFSFHFQPQGLDGDLLMAAGSGGRWCCGQAVCVFFPLSQSVGLLCPLTSRKNGLSFTPELHHYCRKRTATFPALHICGNAEEHPGERPSRPSCYATSAAKRHESQWTSKPLRAPARATLASPRQIVKKRYGRLARSPPIR